MLLSFLVGLAISCAGQQSSAIHVTVIDVSGALIPAAEVRIVGQPALFKLLDPYGSVTFMNINIAPGTYQINATCRGFKEKTVLGVVVVEGKTTDLSIELKQAPPKASDFKIHETIRNVNIYSEKFRDIGQPVLCQAPIPEHQESYRFMWVPTFEHPVFLRIDVDQDGTATLLTVVWSGQGGYEWGKPVKTVRTLTWEEENNLFATIADIGFWTLPSEVEGDPGVIVFDGTEWLIEVLKDGNCHVVTRYASPLTELFEHQFLAKVAKLKPYYVPDR